MPASRAAAPFLPALLTVLTVLAGLAACGETPPEAGAPPPLVLSAPSAGAAAAAAHAYFESACGGCHDEGPRDCLVPESFHGGRLGPVFDAIPAHEGIAVAEGMRRALRLCAAAD